MKKKVLLSWVAASVLTLASGCSNQKEKQKDSVPMRVQCEVIRENTDVHVKNYIGIVEEEYSISVGFTGSGTISKVYVSEGETVRKGQLIAEIDKTQAQNMLTAAQAQMDQANDAYHRLKQLHDNNSLPEMEWIEVQSKVQQAQASLDMAKKTLADCSIHAPESGIIGKGVMNVGEVVLPALPVAKVLVIDEVKIRASIPEKEIAGISDETTSEITLQALPDETFTSGKIEKCVEANLLTHTYDIKINVSNISRKLLPGMVARVKLTNADSKEVLTIPVTSVRKDAYDRNYVWTRKEGKAYRTIVTLGMPKGSRMVVTGGLQQGDVVITEGYQKLSEGMEVYE